MKARPFLIFVLFLSVIFVAQAYAGGAYQRTDDRKKTLVWNNDPQPGDTATWSGERDAEGYATGPGTLTWSRLSRGFTTGSNVATVRKLMPISRYTGTMAQGKFSGPVITVDHGKTYHAKFVDGQRQGNWAAGSLVAKAESAEPAETSEKPKRTEVAKSAATTPEAPVTEKASSEKKEPDVAEQTTEDIPAAGPEKTDEPSQPSEAAKSTATDSSKPATPLIAQASTQMPDESATPRQPVTRKAALAPGAVRAIDRPGSGPTKKTDTAASKQSTRAKSSEEKTEKVAKAKPVPTKSAEQEVEAAEQTPAEGPTTVAKDVPPPPTLHTDAAKTQPKSTDKPVDDSVRALTGPPSSLRTKAPPPETNPPTQIPTAPASASAAPASAPSTPKLTAVQAMDIADIEARTRGYDLGDYQLPKAEYNAANDTWAVAYAGRGADGSVKKFNVTVQDKSGKAEVKK